MNIKKLFLVLAIVIIPTVFALADGPGGPGGGATGTGGPGGFGGIPVGGSTPIDGGMSFLLLFGAAYGAKKIRKEKV